MSILRTTILFVFVFTSIYGIHVFVKNEKKGEYCIILDSDIAGTVNYYSTETNETTPYNFVINGSISSEGECHEVQTNKSTEHVDILFLPNDITPQLEARERWSLKLIFEAPEGDNAPSFKISKYSLSAVFYPDVFNATIPSYVYEQNADDDLEWSAMETHGFTCTKSGLSLTNSSTVEFSNLKVLAFAVLENSTFPQNQLFEQCKFDVRTSDIVPIVVGACLAGLVIVVLIAYIIGRARAKRQGYASV